MYLEIVIDRLFLNRLGLSSRSCLSLTYWLTGPNFIIPESYYRELIVKRQFENRLFYSTSKTNTADLGSEGSKTRLEVGTPYCKIVEGESSAYKLDPFYVTGFADAESSFVVSISKVNWNDIGWQVTPSFSIEIHLKDLALLKKIQSFFGVGTIRLNEKNYTVIYSVRSHSHLINVIIPHFIKYPLLTQKRADYELFKQVVELMANKQHLTTEGFHKILGIRASINNGLPPRLREAFPDIKPVERPPVEFKGIVNPYWVSGFVEGEGCFAVGIQDSKKTRTGSLVSLRFKISQHSRDRLLIKSFIDYFGCGIYYERISEDEFVVTKISDVVEKIIPFFDAHPLQGNKALDYADFRTATEIIKNRGHLTEEGLEQLQKIKVGMNTGRTTKL